MGEITRRNFLKSSAALCVGASIALSGARLSALAEEDSLKVRAAVFSPTGGTMNATYLLASMLSNNPEMIEQTPLSSRDDVITFNKDELAILSAPSYVGRIPFAPNLFTNLKGNDTPCVLVAAFGNRDCENNFAQMNKIATENGFVVIGAIALVTPHIFGARAGHSRPDVEDHPTIREFAEIIRDKVKTGAFTTITVEGDESLPEEKPSMKSRPEKTFDSQLCIMCGACTQNCPEGAIDAATLVINEDLCIQCQRCSHVCPTGARTYILDWNKSDSSYAVTRKPVTYIV